MTKTNTRTELGKRLRIAREQAGMTQEELARRAGYDAKTVRRIELGTSPGSFRALVELEQALGLPAGHLVGAEESPPKPTTPQPTMVSITTGQDLMNFLAAADAYNQDIDDADTPEAIELVKEVLDAIELAQIWKDLSPVQRYDEQLRLSRTLGNLRAQGWQSIGVAQTYYAQGADHPLRLKVALLRVWNAARRLKDLEQAIAPTGIDLDAFRRACETGDVEAISSAWGEIQAALAGSHGRRTPSVPPSPLN